MANFNLDDYVTVDKRIEKFYKDNPMGVIQTDIIFNQEGVVIIKASVYRNQEENKPCVGHAREKMDSSFINKTSYVENCETSAVGRALAMMGYEIKKGIASREEIASVKINMLEEAEFNPSERTRKLYSLGIKKGYGASQIILSTRTRYKKYMEELTDIEADEVRRMLEDLPEVEVKK